MRLFVALDLPGRVKDALARVIDELRPLAPKAKWVPRENLHLTLAFLGETPEERLAEISGAIAGAVSELVDFRTHLEGAGVFPSPRRARVLWVGLADAAGGIAALADAVSAALEPLGFSRESRPFVAHLTLARLREPAPLAVPGLELDSTPFQVERVTLFRSHLARPAPRYSALATFPFRREPG